MFKSLRLGEHEVANPHSVGKSKQIFRRQEPLINPLKRSWKATQDAHLLGINKPRLFAPFRLASLPLIESRLRR